MVDGGTEVLLRVAVSGEAWKRRDRAGVASGRIRAEGGALECAAPAALAV